MNNAQRYASASQSTVQGRLTLTSLTPFLPASVRFATTVYFTPLPGAGAPTVAIWNGTAFVQTTFSELSNVLSDTTKNPAAATAGQVYDLFVWSDAGTLRLSRGPAWSLGTTAGSNTARGSGTGSTALTRVQGIPVNAVAIANGPAAGYGTYVGTIATDTSGATVSMFLGGAGTSGQAAWLGMWNMYNRAPVSPGVYETTTSHTPNGTTGSPAAYCGGQPDTITVVIGLPEDPVSINFRSGAVAATTNTYQLFLALNGTAIPGAVGANVGPSTTTARFPVTALYQGVPGAGLSTYSALEAGASSPTVYDLYTMAFTATILM